MSDQSRPSNGDAAETDRDAILAKICENIFHQDFGTALEPLWNHSDERVGDERQMLKSTDEHGTEEL